jgi:hypothetical protein
MSAKSKVLAAFLVVTVVVGVGFLFWKTLVLADYEVTTDIPVKE